MSKAYTLQMRGGKEGGGKGALITEERTGSLTQACGNDKYLFQPIRKDSGMSNWTVDDTKMNTVYVGEEIANTLQARDYKDPQKVIDAEKIDTEEYAVRRLMPIECLRLQGMPDDWFDGVEHKDSAAYKACGNGMTLNVVVYVLGGIVDLMERMEKKDD